MDWDATAKKMARQIAECTGVKLPIYSRARTEAFERVMKAEAPKKVKYRLVKGESSRCECLSSPGKWGRPKPLAHFETGFRWTIT